MMFKIFVISFGLVMMTKAITGRALNSTDVTTTALVGQKATFDAPCEIDADCVEDLICSVNKKCFFKPPPMPVLPTGKKLSGFRENCKTDEDCTSDLQCSTEHKCEPRVFHAPPLSDCTVSGCPGSESECDSITKSCRSLGGL